MRCKTPTVLKIAAYRDDKKPLIARDKYGLNIPEHIVQDLLDGRRNPINIYGRQYRIIPNLTRKDKKRKRHDIDEQGQKRYFRYIWLRRIEERLSVGARTAIRFAITTWP